MMQYLLLGAAGAAAGAVIFCNLSAWLVPKAQLATLDYLAQAKLQTINSAKTNFSVSIWTYNFICLKTGRLVKCMFSIT